MSIASHAKKLTNLNTLDIEEKKHLARSTYASESYFQHLFQQDMMEFDCKPISINLRNEIMRLLVEKGIVAEQVEIEKLHEQVSDELKTYNFNDGVNKISTFFYETDKQFESVYHQLIQYIRQHIVKEAFFFQATPTIRIHCPNGINSDHYPRYHTDIGYGHPPEEINIWIPLTDLMEGHGFRIMSLANSTEVLEQFDYSFNDFIHSAIENKEFTQYCHSQSKPVTTDFGNMLAFDSRCVHTGEPLKAHTRASIDIRILPVSQYDNMDIEYQGSGRRKILFTPGHCYNEKHSDLLFTIKE